MPDGQIHQHRDALGRVPPPRHNRPNGRHAATPLQQGLQNGEEGNSPEPEDTGPTISDEMARKFGELPEGVRNSTMWAEPIAPNENARHRLLACMIALRGNGWTLAEVIDLARSFPHGWGALGDNETRKVLTALWKEQTEEEAKREEAKRQVGRLRVLSVDDLLDLPDRDYLVKGWLSPGELSLLVGAKNARKSFNALHVGYGLAQGWPRIFGRRAKQTNVLHVICEGENGIGKRVKALVGRYGRCNAFHVIAMPIDLLRSTTTEGDLRDLIEAARTHGVGLIVLDTINRVMPGGAENSPEDMGALLHNMNLLRDATGAHVMGVHHGTQEEGTKSRGHSSLPCGVDVIAQQEWTGDSNGTGTIRLGFARDDISGALGAFRTELVDLGTDADGDAITTLVIEELDPTERPTAKPDSKKMPDNQVLMLDVFRNVLAKHGGTIYPDPEGPPVTGIPRPLLRECLIGAGWFSENLLCKAGGAAKLTDDGYSTEHNAIKGLKRRGFLAFNRGHVWLT